MMRRRELKGIASGLVGTFVSRNNDVDGYWALGKLCALARRADVNLLEIHLHTSSVIAATDPLLTLLASRYAERLASMLARRDIPSSMVRSACIAIQFGTTDRFPVPPPSTWGAPFICTFTLTDDLGVERCASLTAWCGPHDPRRESRSARAGHLTAVGPKTSQLATTLADIVALLRSENEAHWSRFMNDCRARLVASDYSAVEKLLSSYEGMGSFNDLVLGYSQAAGGWEPGARKLNDELDLLRHKAYELAQDIRRNAVIG
jgi:hypothetical protein